MDIKILIENAFEASKNSYSPYSNFKVGACIELANGLLIKGCNIENAAYGSTMCAERNAIYSAYCLGYRKDDIKSLTIVAECTPIASPCGACRQVLSELLNKDTTIILANKNDYIITNIDRLMPLMFTKESL